MLETPWLHVLHQPAKPKLRLVGFPNAGGEASLFRHWGAKFSRPVEIAALQLPGRAERWSETMPQRWSELVQEVSEALEKISDLPLVFLGHSMGALLAHSVASLRPPALAGLILSAAAPPHRFRTVVEHKLDDAGLLQRVREWGALPPMLLKHPDFLEMLLKVLRDDFACMATYVPSENPPLALPFLVLGGERDPVVSPESLAEWSRYSAATTRLKIYPGEHFYFLRQLEGVVADIEAWLEVVIPGLARDSA